MGTKTTVALATAVSSAAYVLGAPGWAVGAVGLVVGFFGLGGWRMSRLAYKTLARDILALRTLLRHLRNLRKWKKSTIPDIFIETVARHPGKPAILFEDECWTFREVNSYSNRVAHFFSRLGLEQGDTVALFMENCPEYVGIWLGLGKLGVQCAFINYNLRMDALLHCLRICRPRSIIYSPSVGEALCAVHKDIDEALYDNIFSVNGDPVVYQSRALDRELDESITSEEPRRPAKQSLEDCLFFIYTSGTTGLPKAVPIKHLKFLTMADNIRLFGGFRNDDVVYMTLPLYHSNGSILGAGQMVLGGSTLALRRKFSASNFWKDCIKFNVTAFIYIGEVCRYLLAQPENKAQDKGHKVRLAVGNGLKSQIWAEFKERFNIGRICEFYGSTEGNCNMVNFLGRPNSCGFTSVLFPSFYPVKLVKIDPVTGEYVKDSNGFLVQAGMDEPGELIGKISRNPLRQFSGYQNAEATKKKILTDVFRPGDRYFRSGDVLRMDEEGYFYFSDRTGDTYRWKGENVSTTEVEGIMARLLHMQDVVVYGVEIVGTDGRAGMAAIVGTEETVGISDLARSLSKALPAYAVPVFIRLVKQVDLTGTFKLQKNRLRDEGFDLEKVSDPLFLLHPRERAYVPLDATLHRQVLDRELRL